MSVPFLPPASSGEALIDAALEKLRDFGSAGPGSPGPGYRDAMTLLADFRRDAHTVAGVLRSVTADQSITAGAVMEWRQALVEFRNRIGLPEV